MLRARSIVSLIDHLPKSTALSSGVTLPVGTASSRPLNSEDSLLEGVLVVTAFLAYARFKAICSRILRVGVFGVKGSSSTGFAVRLEGDRGVAVVGDLKLFTLGWGLSVCEVRLPGVELGGGLRTDVLAPARKLVVEGFLIGVRVVFREDVAGGGMRDIV